MNLNHILERMYNWDPNHPKEGRLQPDEGVFLHEKATLAQLQAVALQRRRKMVLGNEVTYLVDRNVNYTNVCTIGCTFCAFWRGENSPESYVLDKSVIHTKMDDLAEVGGLRLLMQGGVHPHLPLEWYLDLLSSLKERHPSIALDCFSPIEVIELASKEGVTTKELLTLLKESGLDGLPGGGAEMLVDGVRYSLSPAKKSANRWLEVMEEAQELRLRTSATNVIGLGESIEERFTHLALLRDSQERALNEGREGFVAFIAWPFKPEGTALARNNPNVSYGVGPTEYLKHIALSRLFFDNLAHVQASWLSAGPKIAELALLGGADDTGSTMMEENVLSAFVKSSSSKECDMRLKDQRMSMEEGELQAIIHRTGFIPRKRDGRYNKLETQVVSDVHETWPSPPPKQQLKSG